MADVVKVLIEAVDNASGVIKSIWGQVDWLTDSVKTNAKSIDKWARDNKQSFKTLAIAWAAVTAAVAAIWTMAVMQASKMQDLRIELDVLTGSAERGKEMFGELQKAASTTPFETSDLVRATSTMLQFGVAQDEVMKNMMMLGDISWGNAGKLQSLALVFWQISSAGKLTGQDLLQLVNLGFNPLKSMSDRTGESMSDLRDKMSDGAISFEMVKKEMELATAEGGLFFNMMDKKSKTFSWVMSTMKDNISITMAALWWFADGEVIEGGLLDMLTKGMQALMPYLESFSSRAANNPEIARNILLVTGAVALLVTAFWTIWLVKPSIVSGFWAVMFAVKALWSAMMFLAANPVWLVITALAALAYVVVTNRDVISAKITQAIDWIRAKIEPFVTWLTMAWTTMSTAISTAWTSTWDWLNEATAWYFEYLSVLFGAFKALFTGDFHGFIEGIKNARQLGLDIWRNMFNTVMNAIRALGKLIWEGIKADFTAAINWVANVFTTSKQLIEAGFDTMLSGLSGAAKSVFNGVVGIIEGFINKAIWLLNKLISAANNIPWISIPMIAEISIGRLKKGGIAGQGFRGGETMWKIAQNFATGGVVKWPGGIDNVPAMLTAGEVVLNAAQQRMLAGNLQGAGSGSTIVVNVSGNSFYGDDEEFAQKIGDTIMQDFKNHYSFQSF